MTELKPAGALMSAGKNTCAQRMKHVLREPSHKHTEVQDNFLLFITEKKILDLFFMEQGGAENHDEIRQREHQPRGPGKGVACTTEKREFQSEGQRKAP